MIWGGKYFVIKLIYGNSCDKFILPRAIISNVLIYFHWAFTDFSENEFGLLSDRQFPCKEFSFDDTNWIYGACSHTRIYEQRFWCCLHSSAISCLFLCPLRFTGEVEFTARKSGISAIIVFSTIIPLLLLIIVISYRHIQQKNLETEAKEKEMYFAELERERQEIVERMYGDDRRKEIEIVKYLEEREKLDASPNQIQSNVIDVDKKLEQIDHHGDSTDDEFFEMPLPPVPSTSSPQSGKLSITDNEKISPSTARIQETPKVDNTINVFNFPPQPTRPAPPPPGIKGLNPLPLPPVPPRPSSASPPISPPCSPKPENDPQNSMQPVDAIPKPESLQRESKQPIVVDVTPKALLQSDF